MFLFFGVSILTAKLKVLSDQVKFSLGLSPIKRSGNSDTLPLLGGTQMFHVNIPTTFTHLCDRKSTRLACWVTGHSPDLAVYYLCNLRLWRQWKASWMLVVLTLWSLSQELAKRGISHVLTSWDIRTMNNEFICTIFRILTLIEHGYIVKEHAEISFKHCRLCDGG